MPMGSSYCGIYAQIKLPLFAISGNVASVWAVTVAWDVATP